MNELTLSEKLPNKIQTILESPTQKLSDLAKIAGLSLAEDYIGVDLSGEDLSNDDLSDANFSYADLSHANLSKTFLKKVDFRNANLEDAILRLADLSLASLKETRISEKTKIDDKWRLVWEIVNEQFKDSYLTNKDLSFANLSYANLQKVHLNQTILKGALLEGVNLESADLRDTNFESADLRGANLTKASIDETTNFASANVESMRFGGNFGLPIKVKEDLISRGAKWEEDAIAHNIFVPLNRKEAEEELGFSSPLQEGIDTEIALERE